MEDIHPNTEETLKHYGYDSDSAAPAMGLWPNDGTMIAKLKKVPEVLRMYKAEERKIRVVFDYDPDYPRAVLQIWGLQPATLSPDMGTHGEILAK